MFIVIIFILAQSLSAQPAAQRVRQPREVVEAYRVVQKFQELMAEDLDFDRAFEATFTKDARRRREIAITEGEFGNIDLSRVDDATLVDAFKARMQIFYLMLALVISDNKDELELLFPPKAFIERKPPRAPEEFRSYADQLKSDAKTVRADFNKFASQNPAVAKKHTQVQTGTVQKDQPTIPRREATDCLQPRASAWSE